MIEKNVVDLNFSFSLKYLALLHYFLGVDVTYSDDSMHLSQQKFMRELLDGAHFNDAWHVNIVMHSRKILSKIDGQVMVDSLDLKA